jgi:Transglycosylase-like domain
MFSVKSIVVTALAVLAIAPAAAQADSAICHNGVLSDDAGQGCADGLYEQTYGSGGSAGSSSGICNDGILSNDAGQNCADGLYERTYGSGAAPSSPVTTPSSGSGSGSSTGGSSNSMVNPHCESGGNSQVVDPSGTYWGKYQFDRQTWVAHGGSPGSYGSASEGEQDQVASRVTYDAWPNC